jgi:hypothetical protein
LPARRAPVFDSHLERRRRNCNKNVEHLRGARLNPQWQCRLPGFELFIYLTVVDDGRRQPGALDESLRGLLKIDLRYSLKVEAKVAFDATRALCR